MLVAISVYSYHFSTLEFFCLENFIHHSMDIVLLVPLLHHFDFTPTAGQPPPIVPTFFFFGKCSKYNELLDPVFQNVITCLWGRVQPTLPDLDRGTPKVDRGSRAIAILLVQYHWGKVGGQKCMYMKRSERKETEQFLKQ